MHTLPPHGAVCVFDLRIKLRGVYIIFFGSSKSMHTAPDEIFKLTYIQYMFYLYSPYCIHNGCTKYVWYIVFVVSIIIFVCAHVYLLFLSSPEPKAHR